MAWTILTELLLLSIEGKGVREQANVDIWIDGSSKCKGPEALAFVVPSRSCKEASLARVDGKEERVVVDQLRDDGDRSCRFL